MNVRYLLWIVLIIPCIHASQPAKKVTIHIPPSSSSPALEVTFHSSPPPSPTNVELSKKLTKIDRAIALVQADPNQVKGVIALLKLPSDGESTCLAASRIQDNSRLLQALLNHQSGIVKQKFDQEVQEKFNEIQMTVIVAEIVPGRVPGMHFLTKKPVAGESQAQAIARIRDNRLLVETQLKYQCVIQ